MESDYTTVEWLRIDDEFKRLKGNVLFSVLVIGFKDTAYYNFELLLSCAIHSMH